MKDAIKTFVQIVHILSFGGLLLCGALGVVYEIIGPAKYEQFCLRLVSLMDLNALGFGL